MAPALLLGLFQLQGQVEPGFPLVGSFVSAKAAKGP